MLTKSKQLIENKLKIEEEICNLNKSKEETQKKIIELNEQLKKRENFYVETELKYVDSLDGYSFEKYSTILLTKLGYEALTTQASNDGGADIIASKDGKKYAIQCKNYSENVEYKAIQEIVAAKQLYECDIAVVLTNSFFTKQARERADKLNVELWDRNSLKKLLFLSYNYDVEHIDMEIDYATYEYNYIENKYLEDSELSEESTEDGRPDPFLQEAIDTVIETGQASTSFIQRRFKVGYARAGRIIDQMEEMGIISEYQGSKPREVLMSKERWEKLKSNNI